MLVPVRLAVVALLLAACLSAHAALTDNTAPSRSGKKCISSVDAARQTLRFSDGLEHTLQTRDRVLLKAALLSLVRIQLPQKQADNDSELRISSYTDVECDNGTEATFVATVVASRSRMIRLLGPVLYDVLTLGARDAALRTNISYLVLPAVPCEGSEEEVYLEMSKVLLVLSGMDAEQWSINVVSNADRESAGNMAILLFTVTGLFSMMQTFITIPLLTFVAAITCCKRAKISNTARQVCTTSFYVMTILVSMTFVGYWIGMTIYHYRCDVAAKILFHNSFFSPFSMCLQFYMLSGITSFFGGLLFGLCLAKTQHCWLHQIGVGFVAPFITAAIYHSFFILPALVEDFLNVFSYLVVFMTAVLVLFIGITAIITQYLKSRFRGYFFLMSAVQVIGFLLYVTSVKAFSKLILDPGTFSASTTYFIVVAMASLLALAFSVSILATVAIQNDEERSPKKERDLKLHPEQPSPGRASGENGELEVVRRTKHSNMADLAAVAQELGYVVLIPTIVRAWEGRKGKEEVQV